MLLVFAVIYLFYFLSLEKCNEGLEKCSTKISWIKSIIKKEIISCVLLEIMLQLMLLKIISKKNLKFYDHGYYNFFFFFLLLFIFTVVFIPIDFCIIYCKNEINSNRLIIIYILLLVLFLLLYILQGRIVIIGQKDLIIVI